MTSIETLDGTIELTPTVDLFDDVEAALSFWYAYRRHPYRSLGGIRDFMITGSDFRYVDSPQFWRFTLDQTETMVFTLWPDEGPALLARLRRDYPRKTPAP